VKGRYANGPPPQLKTPSAAYDSVQFLTV